SLPGPSRRGFASHLQTTRNRPRRVTLRNVRARALRAQSGPGGGGREERAVKRVTTVGRGAKPASELLPLAFVEARFLDELLVVGVQLLQGAQQDPGPGIVDGARAATRRCTCRRRAPSGTRSPPPRSCDRSS